MNNSFTINPWIYFGEYVSKLRVEKKIGIAQFENGADLTMQTIYNVQNTMVAPRLDSAYKILSVLGSNMTEFEIFAKGRIERYEKGR